MHLGTLRLQGLGLPQDRATGIKAYERAAKSGSVEAALQLGIAAATGADGPINYEQAAHWYQQAAEQGSAVAAYNLAQLHLQGLGVSPDGDQAMRWLSAAAELHYLPAITVLYQQALAVTGEGDSLGQALPWIVRAAELGDAEATQILIDLLQQPERVSTSGLLKALEKIATKGNAHAQLAVGDLYAEGIFLKEDAALARRWYEEAAAQQHELAIERLQNTAPPSAITRGR
jgi:hypothetical protein